MVTMRQFQFTVSDPTSSPPIEAKDGEGNVILTPIKMAETITQAMSELQPWLEGGNDYQRQFRVYRPVRK